MKEKRSVLFLREGDTFLVGEAWKKGANLLSSHSYCEMYKLKLPMILSFIMVPKFNEETKSPVLDKNKQVIRERVQKWEPYPLELDEIYCNLATFKDFVFVDESSDLVKSYYKILKEYKTFKSNFNKSKIKTKKEKIK
jgi:hypothetical protein